MDYVATVQTKVRFTAENESSESALKLFKVLLSNVSGILYEEKLESITNNSPGRAKMIENIINAVEDMLKSVEVCDVKPMEKPRE